MIKSKKYVIEGRDKAGKPVKVRASQSELTLGQDKQLIIMLEGLSLADIASKGIRGVVAYLEKKALLEQFFDLILQSETPVSEVIVWDSVKNSTWLEILEDFFLLNRKSIERLVASFQRPNLKAGIIRYFQNSINSLRGGSTPQPSQDPALSTK